MVPVPEGIVTAQGAAGPSGRRIGPFWISRTEVTWNAYDLFVLRLDEAGTGDGGPDAVSRPSKPYISMDRGFGHSGYPAISMSYHGANSYCRWLSRKTGRHYRLPTEAEWRYVCRLGGIGPTAVGEHAWFSDNAGHATHPVATKKPHALGVYDLYGNASEWCTSEAGGGPVTLGGSFRDAIADLGCGARVPPSERWNESDPQLPKSIWWLADGGFVGFRVVCTPTERNDEEAERTRKR